MNNVDLSMCLGFDFSTTFQIAGAITVPLDAADVGMLSSFAGACHIHVMDDHFADYVLSPANIPAFAAIPGFPSAGPFTWLDVKQRGKDVLGNIGEAVAAIVAQEAFQLATSDIAHLKVKHQVKTPDYIMRFDDAIAARIPKHYPALEPGVKPPEWWPVESKSADCNSDRRTAIKRAFRQLASYWREEPSAAGFGLAVGYQYMTTSRQRQNILVSLFLPKTQATVQSRINAMTAAQMAKAEDDVALKGALHGC